MKMLKYAVLGLVAAPAERLRLEYPAASIQASAAAANSPTTHRSPASQTSDLALGLS